MRLLLSNLDYAAFVQYSPRGNTEISIRSRKARDVIKGGQDRALSDLARKIKEEIARGGFAGWFDTDCTLIPIPRSAPLKDKESLWVPKNICEALVAEGIGSEIAEKITRITSVKKSAFQAQGNRPTVENHYDSFAIEDALVAPKPSIILVDDFVSRGRTLIAAARRVSEAYPQHRVRAFAMVRTRGFVEVDKIICPFEGQIGFDGVEAHRSD